MREPGSQEQENQKQTEEEAEPEPVAGRVTRQERKEGRTREKELGAECTLTLRQEQRLAHCHR